MNAKNLVPAVLRARLGNSLRRARLYGRWLRHEVPQNPRFELYARMQGRADRAAFLAERADRDLANSRNVTPFSAPGIPKVIWMYWQQGEDEAPFVVRRCIESWRRHNPDWEVRVLDADTVGTFANMSDCPKHLPPRFFADMLRLRLLKVYGGVWADATVYCHRPLQDWIALHAMTGFFAFRNPGPARWIASWFLISEPDHILPRVWEAVFAPYMRRLRHVPDMYFVFFYMFQWKLRNTPEAMAAWTRAPSLPAQPAFFMMAALQGQLDLSWVQDIVASGFPVSKLSWKLPVKEAEFNAFCAGLEAITPA